MKSERIGFDKLLENSIKSTISHGDDTDVDENIDTSSGDTFRLTSHEQRLIDQIHKASSVFEEENRLQLIGDIDLEDSLRLPEFYIRRSIRFCKHISTFRSLNRTDQAEILKAFCLTVIMIRACFCYEVQQDGFRMLESEEGDKVFLIKFPIFVKSLGEEELQRNRKFTNNLHVKMENDVTIRNLVGMEKIHKLYFIELSFSANRTFAVRAQRWNIVSGDSKVNTGKMGLN